MLPDTDERLPEFQQQMLDRGWDGTQLWSLDSTLFAFASDRLNYIWKQNPHIKPVDDLLFASMDFIGKEDTMSYENQQLGTYFWNWFEINILKRMSKENHYAILRTDFFKFLLPRLSCFTDNAKSVLVKDGTYDSYFKMLDDTLDILIPISVNERNHKVKTSKRKYNYLLHQFITNINGLWI